MRQAIRQELDALPEQYDQAEYDAAVNAVYAHVYEAYRSAEESIYA